MEKLNFYKLRAKVICEDLSEVLGVLAVWDGTGETEYGLCYRRSAPAGARRARHAAAASGRARPPPISAPTLVDADAYEAHRIALGVPRGGLDFIYGDAFPHETDMDQLGGVDFDKGCYVGQEVVSRIEHRGTARNRVVPIAYDDFAPDAGVPVMAGDKQVGTHRLDRQAAAGSRCCASTASPMRSPPARR